MFETYFSRVPGLSLIRSAFTNQTTQQQKILNEYEWLNSLVGSRASTILKMN